MWRIVGPANTSAGCRANGDDSLADQHTGSAYRYRCAPYRYAGGADGYARSADRHTGSAHGYVSARD